MMCQGSLKTASNGLQWYGCTGGSRGSSPDVCYTGVTCTLQLEGMPSWLARKWSPRARFSSSAPASRKYLLIDKEKQYRCLIDSISLREFSSGDPSMQWISLSWPTMTMANISQLGPLTSLTSLQGWLWLGNNFPNIMTLQSLSMRAHSCWKSTFSDSN